MGDRREEQEEEVECLEQIFEGEGELTVVSRKPLIVVRIEVCVCVRVC